MQPPDDPEQRLVRLLALKRYETPPPGFFGQLPVRILVNLRAGSVVVDVPWWTRVWRVLVHEPMIGLSYAALGLGAVLFGISVLETAIDVQNPPIGLTQGLFPAASPELVLADPQGPTPGMIYRVAEPTPAMWLQSSLNPLGQSSAATPVFRFETIEFTPAGTTSAR